MRKLLIGLVCLTLLGFLFTNQTLAADSPFAHPNNKFGVHILFPSELSDAAKLVNSDGGDWGYVDHDLAGTRYSQLTQITTKNVSRLVKACAYSFPDKEPSQTAPMCPRAGCI